VFDETSGSQVEQVDLDELDDEEAPCIALRNMSIGDVCPKEFEEPTCPLEMIKRLRASCKYFSVCMEEVDEHYFLFGLELRAYPQCLLTGAAGVEGDGLCGLRWLEIVIMLLGVGNLSSEVLQVGNEHL
jgi:hypothetical protein